MNKKDELLEEINSLVKYLYNYCVKNFSYPKITKEVYGAYYSKFYYKSAKSLKEITSTNSVIIALSTKHLEYFLKYLKSLTKQIEGINKNSFEKDSSIFDVATFIAIKTREDFITKEKVTPIESLKEEFPPNEKELLEKLQKEIKKLNNNDLNLLSLKSIKKEIRDEIENILQIEANTKDNYIPIISNLYKGFYNMSYTSFVDKNLQYKKIIEYSSYTDFMNIEQFILHNASLLVILSYLKKDKNNAFIKIDKLSKISLKLGKISQEFYKEQMKERTIDPIIKKIESLNNPIKNMRVSKTAKKIINQKEDPNQLSLFDNERGM